MPDEPPAPRPRLSSGYWYLVSVALIVLAPMAGAMIAATAWDPIREATVQPITEPIDPAGRSLAIVRDLEPSRPIVCTSRPVSDPKATPRVIEAADVAVTVEQNGSTWHLVAVDVTPGKGARTVSCAPDKGRIDDATYGYALVSGFEAAKRGQAVSVAGGVGGAALALVVAFRRMRMVRRLNAE